MSAVGSSDLPIAQVTAADWAAPQASAPLRAVVEVPGSKSLTNRLLVLAALADGPGTIRGALRSRDADLMIDALRQLGVQVNAGAGDDFDATTLQVVPPPVLRGKTAIDTGLAGTVMRFLPPVAALADGPVAFDGDDQARLRPMAGLLDALDRLGVQATSERGGKPSHLPFTIVGDGAVEGGAVDVDASASSQFVSALLLAAPRFERGLTVRHVGQKLPSLPHIEMTVAALREAGVAVDDSIPGQWRVEPGPIHARDVRVEPDLSNALPFLAAALVVGGSVSVPGWPSQTTQPGSAVPDLLTRLGGEAELNDSTLTVTGSGQIRPVDLDLSAVGELAPNIAALCALADGTSRLRGIAHLRGHETDRLAALAAEINRLGGHVLETADGLIIHGRGPGGLHGELFRTYHDHRMATSAALLGLRVPGLVVENVDTTAKTLPGFTAMWQDMLSGSGD